MAAAPVARFRWFARFVIPPGAVAVAAGLAFLAAVYLVDYPANRLAPEAAASLNFSIATATGCIPCRCAAADGLPGSGWARWRRR